MIDIHKTGGAARGVAIEVSMKFDIEELADGLHDDQLRAFCAGLADVIEASRLPPPPEQKDEG